MAYLTTLVPILLLHAILLKSSATRNPGSSEQLMQKCGTQLANMLADVCNGGFNSPKRGVKKYFMNRDEASKFLRKASRNKRSRTRSQGGIVNECCRQSCDMATLKQYCSQPENSDIPSTPSTMRMNLERTFLFPDIETIMPEPIPNEAETIVEQYNPEESENRKNEIKEAELSDNHQSMVGSFQYSRERPFKYVWGSTFTEDQFSEENLNQ